VTTPVHRDQAGFQRPKPCRLRAVQLQVVHWVDRVEPAGDDHPVQVRDAGEGQIRNESVGALQFKLGRRFVFGRHELEVALNSFNVLNAGNFQQYAAGANQEYSTANFMRKFNRQPTRGFQLTFVNRF